MLLEKVSYLTIGALAERRQQMERWLDKADVPLDAREAFEGVDGAAYPTLAALLKEAPAWLQRLWDKGVYRGDAAFQWGWYRLFESVAQLADDVCVLMLLDDAQLTQTWDDYVQLAAELPDFDIVQLQQWNPGDSPQHAGCRRFDLRVCEERPDFTWRTHFPGEHALLCSPAGARKCMGHIEQHPYRFIEGVLIDAPNEWRILSPLPPLRSDWVHVPMTQSYRIHVNEGEKDHVRT